MPDGVVYASKTYGNLWELRMVGMMLCPMAKFPLTTLLLN